MSAANGIENQTTFKRILRYRRDIEMLEDGSLQSIQAARVSIGGKGRPVSTARQSANLPVTPNELRALMAEVGPRWAEDISGYVRLIVEQFTTVLDSAPRPDLRVLRDISYGDSSRARSTHLGRLAELKYRAVFPIQIAVLVVDLIGIGKLEIKEADLVVLEERTGMPRTTVQLDGDVAGNFEGFDIL